MLFLAATYFASLESKKFEARKEAEIRARGGLIFFHGPDEMNSWNLAGIGLLVLGSSCCLAAFWLARPKPPRFDSVSVAVGDARTFSFTNGQASALN